MSDERISNHEATSATKTSTTRWAWLAYFLFWSWNIIFLAFMVFGFTPRILPEMIKGIITGLLPAGFLVFGLILALIPPAAMLLGYIILREQPGRLFSLGYVVEGPLMLMLAIRFFVIRQSNPGLTALLAIAGVGMAFFLWQLLDRRIDQHNDALQWLRLSGLTLMLLVSFYAALWIGFYAIPMIWEALKWLANTISDIGILWRNLRMFFTDLLGIEWLWAPFVILGFILALYTATLFVLTPIVVPWLALKAWLAGLQSAQRKRGWVLPAVWCLALAAGVLFLFTLANRQPQGQVFSMLQQRPPSRQEARKLHDQEQRIRAGLLNAYLSPYRYMGAVGEVFHIRDIYQTSLGLPPSQAAGIQALYELVAKPLLYVPAVPKSLRESGSITSIMSIEPEQAARLYRRYFDTPIIEGERDQIIRAVRATWSPDQAEAAWQEVDHREVYLQRQEIKITEQGDWAEVELFEMYLNQTAMNQEVVYYFNLPESAVITGLWLGEQPDRILSFASQVAPRGAAQAVYREQTRVQKDPALVEQIGPRQYRLRAFPVPPIQMDWDEDSGRSVIGEANPLYLWLTYRTLVQEDSWPLPRLADRRNIFWDAETVREINDHPVEAPGEAWLPASVLSQNPATAHAHRFDFENEQSVLLTPTELTSLPALPPNLRLALVIDRSRSMQAHAADISSAISILKQVGLGSQVDVYLTTSGLYGEEPSLVSFSDFSAMQLEFFGGQNAGELLAQFQRLSRAREYDAALVLTDGSGYELGTSDSKMNIPDAPVWLVHLNSDIPLGYDDETLQALQASGGGVAGNIDEALGRLALRLNQAEREQQDGADFLDGYTFRLVPASTAAQTLPKANIHTRTDGFGAIAARFLVQAEIRRLRGELRDPATLDQIHALATQHTMVTPYSSLIVLVNNEQKQLLEQLSQLNDRYKREVETVGQTTPATQTPLTGVPEPEEWLLIGLSAALLAWLAFKHKMQAVRVFGR